MNGKYKVYIKVDEKNRIIEINSSAFITDVAGWIMIDIGEGDKYHHAQGNYLDKPLMDELFRYNYKWVVDEPVLRTEEEKAADATLPVTPEAITVDTVQLRADVDYLLMVGEK